MDRWEIVSAMGTSRANLKAVCVKRGQVSVLDRWIAEVEARSQQVASVSGPGMEGELDQSKGKGDGGRGRKRRRK